ncbi:MAG: hypothetical protein AB7Q27_08755 [Acidimicrobiia bacterium]
MSTHDDPITKRIMIPWKQSRSAIRSRWQPSGCSGDHFGLERAHDVGDLPGPLLLGRTRHEFQADPPTGVVTIRTHSRES